ncbi:hypothetical protein VWN43_05370 [Qipengyuania sp. HL-TH1]
MTSRRDLGLIVALAFALATLGGCEQAGSDRPLLEEARLQLERGDALAAQVQLEQALATGTPREELATLFGESALLKGDLGVAREWLGPGEFSEDSAAAGFQLLGRLEMAEGNLPAAGGAFDRSYRVEPDNAGLWVDIGRLRYRGGEQFEAIAAAERALSIDPNDAEALRFRGQLARDAQGLEAGAELLGRALERQPQNIELRVEYAATLGDAGRARDALRVLRAEGGRAASTPHGMFVQAVIAARGETFDRLATCSRDPVWRAKMSPLLLCCRGLSRSTMGITRARPSHSIACTGASPTIAGSGICSPMRCPAAAVNASWCIASLRPRRVARGQPICACW